MQEQIVSVVGLYTNKYGQNCGLFLAHSAPAVTIFKRTSSVRVESARSSYSKIFKRSKLMGQHIYGIEGLCNKN